MDRNRAVERVHDESGGMTAGCNPAHRCVPPAMAAFLDDDELPRLASREARLTHYHPLVGDVAAAVVVLCRSLARGVPWDAALAGSACGRLDPTVRALDPANLDPLSGGWIRPGRPALRFISWHDTNRSPTRSGRRRRSPVRRTTARYSWGRSAARVGEPSPFRPSYWYILIFSRGAGLPPNTRRTIGMKAARLGHEEFVNPRAATSPIAFRVGVH